MWRQGESVSGRKKEEVLAKVEGADALGLWTSSIRRHHRLLKRLLVEFDFVAVYFFATIITAGTAILPGQFVGQNRSSFSCNLPRSKDGDNLRSYDDGHSPPSPLSPPPPHRPLRCLQ